MLSLFTVVPFALFLIGAAALFAGVRYALAARTGQSPAPPIVLAPDAARKLIAVALTGNTAAVLQAAGDALHIHLNEGSLEEKLLNLAFADVQRKLQNTNTKDTPIITAIAHFTGKSEQEVFDILRASAHAPHTPVPQLIPTVVASLLCLFAFPVFAASPIGMPQRWEAPEQKVVLDPAIFRSDIQSVEMREVLFPNDGQVSYENGYYETYHGNYCDERGFWQRGPVRRWVSNGRHPIARGGVRVVGAVGRGVGFVARGAARVVSAPFRWLFRRR